MTRSETTTLALAMGAVLAFGCFKQPVLCPALDSCGGGMPVGDWTLAAGHPSCSEDLYTPPSDPRLVQADLPPARTPPPDPALYDWCDLLVTGPNLPTDPMHPENGILVRSPNFSYATFPVGSATIHYDANNHYVMSTTRAGEFSVDFPAYCMRAFGAVDTPLDPAALPGTTGTVCDKLQFELRLLSPKKYRFITCMLDSRDPAGQEGCLCGFDVVDIQESSGTVEAPAGSDLLHLPGVNFPEDVSYCVEGTGDTQHLLLTGTDGAYLFDRVGLRTLDLAKVTVNCTDGKQGPGEDGADCGPACPILCSQVNCGDGAQGPGEAGVDCGPNCPKALTCPPAP